MKTQSINVNTFTRNDIDEYCKDASSEAYYCILEIVNAAVCADASLSSAEKGELIHSIYVRLAEFYKEDY